MIQYLNEKEKFQIYRLALQVEDLFGKMVGVKEFEDSIK